MKKLLKLLKKPFNWKTKFPNVNHIIEQAFEVGGVKYYQFADVFSLPYERGLFALMIYEETRMAICARAPWARAIVFSCGEWGQPSGSAVE